jgi:hypothetical protein
MYSPTVKFFYRDTMRQHPPTTTKQSLIVAIARGLEGAGVVILCKDTCSPCIENIELFFHRTLCLKRSYKRTFSYSVFELISEEERITAIQGD